MEREILDKIGQIGEIYTPSFPIEIIQLFSGRVKQIAEITNAISQKGRQVIIYGDRGVGKTSIANIVKIFNQADRQVAKVSCNTQDTFASLFHNVLSGITYNYTEARQKIGFGEDIENIDGICTLSSIFPLTEMSIPNILRALNLVGNPLLIIDEFDRLDAERFDKKLFTDFLKTISDSYPEITVIIVGISEDVSALIHEHGSIERNLGQIHMPTMSADEIKGIILRGEEPLGLKFSNEVVEKIINLSSGYPHFTHALCNRAASAVVLQKRTLVELGDLAIAIRQVVDSTTESLKESYRTATLATKKNIFQDVLYAAAQAKTDEYGYFQATDLELALSEIKGQPMKVNQFTFHLGKFCSEERGEIFRMTGAKNRHRYKFKNPLMKAFVLLKMESEKPVF